jgi:hypothetical protein
MLDVDVLAVKYLKMLSNFQAMVLYPVLRPVPMALRVGSDLGIGVFDLCGPHDSVNDK